MILLHKQYNGEPPIPVLINEHHISKIEPCGGENDGSYISILNSPISIEVLENMVEISKAIDVSKSDVVTIARHLRSMSVKSKPVDNPDFPF